ncbi:NADP-dependent oxidoreductase [Nonomuraea sp. NEAU-A123]|uniref:NADP-dependent oxidoreductase n=1 Tax=Nonomuraea sp. NEAU-A123 TaxID=2839649 RepID=UPI0020324A71|nr:NADP-dependent oxidoreductase [Nonomuraea sp. NEAU-A123]
MADTSVAVHLVARPLGTPTGDEFVFVAEPVPEPSPGTALVENVYLSVDPYMRELMDEGWELHSPLEGRAIGRVIASRDSRLLVGDLVFHRKAWRTHAVVSPAEARVLPVTEGVPISAYLGILGGTGLTAYVALSQIARLRAGESVFISGAAGGVGTAAGQIARIMGAKRIVGSTGSAAKAKHLTEELGFDAAFDYHQRPVAELLAQAAPDGVDVCVENVGGEHLEAAIGAVRDHGRIVWVGAISQYNSAQRPPAAPRNLYEVVGKSIRLEGFLVREYGHLQGELEALLIPHIQSGRLVADQTVVTGFNQVVEAFLGMLHGRNIGKMIVQVADQKDVVSPLSTDMP